MLEHLNSLIVEPDLDARTRLREVLRVIAYKQKHDFAKTYKEGGQWLDRNKPYDSVFVASTKKKRTIIDFLEEVKSKANPEYKPVVVVCLKADHQDSAYVAELYCAGVHGFICEPYSAEKLLELVATVREQLDKQADKERKALRSAGLLLSSAIKLTDERAECILDRKPSGGYRLKQLREIAAALQGLYEIVPEERFVDLVVRKFEEAQPLPKFEERANARKGRRRVERKIAVHPGVILRSIISTRGLDKEKLLASMRVDTEQFEAVLREEGPIHEEMAREIARMLGKTSKYWMGLQLDFDRTAK